MVNLIKKSTLVLLAIGVTLIAFGAVSAQESSMKGNNLSIESAVICEGVEDRAPVGPGNVFPVSVDRLYCYTRIVGATEQLTITHVWYFGDKERARVPLSVRAASWRTYSSKKIQPHEIGDWKVEILGPDGEILKTLLFETIL